MQRPQRRDDGHNIHHPMYLFKGLVDSIDDIWGSTGLGWVVLAHVTATALCLAFVGKLVFLVTRSGVTAKQTQRLHILYTPSLHEHSGSNSHADVGARLPPPGGGTYKT